MDHAEDAAADAGMTVAVACSPRAGVAVEVSVRLARASTVREAIRTSGLLERFPELGDEPHTLGVWGRACPPEARLRDGDRVEIYRPLTMDPNEARRLRAKRLRDRKPR